MRSCVVKASALVFVLMLAAVASTGGAEPEAPQPDEPINGLKAVLRIQGETFREGEDIPLELEVQNVSSASILIYRSVGANAVYTGYMRFLVRRGNGAFREVGHGGTKQLAATEPNHMRLEPGVSNTHRMLVRPPKHGHVDLGRLPEGYVANIHDSLLPGEYELLVKVIYKDDGKEFGVNNAWTGTVVSNPVHFQVIEAKDE